MATTENTKRRNRNLRKRPVETNDDDDDVTIVQRTTTTKSNKSQRTGPASAVTTQTKSNTSQKTGPVFAVAAQKTLQSESGDQGATRQLETETEFDRDARSRREKKLQAEGSKNYRGLTGYVDYTKGLKKEATVSQEKATGAHGPLRGSTYIRMSARFDYQPDVCKDYKETGFCSFGDSCKFLHDRTDYKAGWELEQEWEEERKKEREALIKLAAGIPASDDEDNASNEDESDLPFACFICREPWERISTPVVTPCKHYFCETCALEHNKKSPKCAVCEKATRGIFNVAHDIVKQMKKRKE
eukprot:g5152.t1